MPQLAYSVIEKLWRLNRIFCSSDYDASLEILKKYLPFKIHEYRSNVPHKGWEIPPKWDLVKGIIRFEGKTIYEVDHPLKIIGLSRTVKDSVSRDELRKHLFYDRRDPNNIPYHFRQHYRPWDRDWGFCVPQNFYDSLQEGQYEVEIDAKESEGYLKVAEYVKEGQYPFGFAFVAHLDHPGMANDDLAGVAVGVDLLHRLSQIETKFTYRLVLVQEILGSVFYFDKTYSKGPPIIESCFLEMLGTKTPLALQYSRLGKSCLEHTLEQVLKKSSLNYRTGPFRSVICNDEVVWESFQIPMCSLSRYPYPEYHSDKDNPSIIDRQILEETVELLYQTVLELDKKIMMEKHFEGVYSLAHPNYNLYIDPGQPAFSALPSESTMKLRSLMDEMPLLPQFTCVNTLADQIQLPFEEVYNYLQLWKDKGLISLT